jgi:pyridoxamine 5'-phosphate oxidase
MNFASLRQEYETNGLDMYNWNASPIEEFETWFSLAVAHSPGDWFEPNAMTLATSDRQGRVMARIVLLKGIRNGELLFFSNYLSDKGMQIAQNDQVSLCFHWPYLARQVRVEGTASKSSPEASLEYFHSRTRGAQIGAWASAQSSKIESRAELESRVREIANQYAGQPIPLPPFWGGYKVLPNRFEFWQGRNDRLHDRFAYIRGTGSKGWIIERLAP